MCPASRSGFRTDQQDVGDHPGPSVRPRADDDFVSLDEREAHGRGLPVSGRRVKFRPKRARGRGKHPLAQLLQCLSALLGYPLPEISQRYRMLLAGELRRPVIPAGVHVGVVLLRRAVNGLA